MACFLCFWVCSILFHLSWKILKQNKLEFGDLTYQIVAKQERCADQTYAQGDSSIFAGWSRSYSSNSGMPSSTLASLLLNWVLFLVLWVCLFFNKLSYANWYFGQVEHVIREQNTWAAYEILELFCEFILARVPIIENQR